MIEIINDFSNLIQIIVVVLIFGGERYYEYYFRKKELIKEWYYKIFIDPNLEKIELFFKSVKEEFEKSQQHLKSISYICSVNDFTKEVAIANGKFQEKKRNFESEVISPISFSNKDISEELTEILRDLEDFYIINVSDIQNQQNTSIIDTKIFKTNIIDTKIFKTKDKIYNTLFKPINN